MSQQRIIKFRAWDKEKKVMQEVSYINFYDEYMRVDESPVTGYNLKIKGTPLMQFTGFVDKNGVEIYEGDVIECTDITREGQELTYSGVVCFSDGWYAIESFVIDGYPSCFIPFNASDLPLIVGNKFENPELLK